jgi:hypothetical protein
MSAIAAWQPVTRTLRLIRPASRDAVGGQCIAHTPTVDGSTTVSAPPVLRSRSRTRRRRRKRSWATPWAFLVPFWSCPALFSVYLSLFGWDLRGPQRVSRLWRNDRQGLMDPLFYRLGLLSSTWLNDPTTALVIIIAIRGMEPA